MISSHGATSHGQGRQQPNCSEFLYWIKAARSAGRARWAAEGRRRSCLPPRSRQPLATQRARTASVPTEPRKQPDQPDQHHRADTMAAPHTATTTRRTRPPARPRRIRGDTSQFAGQSKQGSVAQAGGGAGDTRGRCSPLRGSVVADFLWLRPRTAPAPTSGFCRPVRSQA